MGDAAWRAISAGPSLTDLGRLAAMQNAREVSLGTRAANGSSGTMVGWCKLRPALKVPGFSD